VVSYIRRNGRDEKIETETQSDQMIQKTMIGLSFSETNDAKRFAAKVEKEAAANQKGTVHDISMLYERNNADGSQ
jgi:hypothetical protein